MDNRNINVNLFYIIIKLCLNLLPNTVHERAVIIIIIIMIEIDLTF